MKCNEVCEKLSLFIDNELSDEEVNQIESHLQSCESCQKELEEYKNLISFLNSMPEEEPPLGYCKRLHNKLLEESQTRPKISKIKAFNPHKWMKYGSIAAALALILLLGGRNNLGINMAKSENQISSYDMAGNSSEKYSAPRIEEAGFPEMAGAPGINDAKNDYTTEDNVSPRGIADSVLLTSTKKEMKIIKNGRISAQTEDYDLLINELTEKLSSLGGFLESNNTEVYQVYNGQNLMYGSVKIRVPQEHFYELIEYLEDTVEVRRKNVNETDVSKEYYEKDNKVNNFLVQEEHLRELFEKANTVEESLLIENELRRIRTEIDALNISLSDIDDRSSMSTIDMEIEEVMGASLALKTKDGVWDRSKNGFINTVNSIIRAGENLLVNIISISPILIPFIIICIVFFIKLKKHWKKTS